MKRQFQVTYLRNHGLSPEQTFLDLGCGTLRGGIPIIEYLEVGNYTGVDVRRQVIEEAAKELRDHKLEPKCPILLTLDEAITQMSTTFDMIWAFQVLIHMEEDRLHEALDLAKKHLKPNGVFFATALIGEFEESEWQGFPVIRQSLDFYEQKAARAGLTVSPRGMLDSFGYGRQGGKPSPVSMLEFRHGN
jgi:cyclopropane fatty-acyl-phospholipid synthase-like methyltransferase